MGVTAHWIDSDPVSNKWKLNSEVTTFQAISGVHSGKNISRYLVNSLDCFGILTQTHSKLLCITADNATNNDAMCDNIETILSHRCIFTFNSTTHHLPCLAHVLNLAITDIMSVITNIAAVETTTAIWEFDPTVSGNHIFGNSIDVIAALHTLAIKIQALDSESRTSITCKLSVVSLTHSPSHSIVMSTGEQWMVCLGMPIFSVSQSTCLSILQMSFLVPSQRYTNLECLLNVSPGRLPHFNQLTGNRSTTFAISSPMPTLFNKSSLLIAKLLCGKQSLPSKSSSLHGRKNRHCRCSIHTSRHLSAGWPRSASIIQSSMKNLPMFLHLVRQWQWAHLNPVN